MDWYKRPSRNDLLACNRRADFAGFRLNGNCGGFNSNRLLRAAQL
jgi:hypothetical protein